MPPNISGKLLVVGPGTVTNLPSRLSQKSKPYLSGCNVAFTLSRRVKLFGTDSHPSAPVSKAEALPRGGVCPVSRLRTKGVTAISEEWIEKRDGEIISVWSKSLGLDSCLYSDTSPDKETRSPIAV